MACVKTKKLIIFGTGKTGSLARYYFQEDSAYEVVGFCADDEFVKSDTWENLPLIALSRLKSAFSCDTYHMHVALSYRKLNRIREEKYFQIKALGYTLASYISSKSVSWPDLSMGDNCFILENQTIQPTVKIGNNVMIWSGNHLGHASVIEDHVYISSHVCIAGHTRIGSRSFLGVNATVKDFTNIGHDVFVGMGALVVRDIEEGSVVLAPKSEVLPSDSRIAITLKKNYFGL